MALSIGSVLIATTGFAASTDNSAELNKAGYSIGYQMGHQFHAVGLKVPATAIAQGFKAGSTGKPSRYTKDETKTIMMAFQTLFQQKSQAAQAKLATKNSKASTAFMQKVAKMKGVKALIPGKLYYQVIKKGHGAIPKKTDTVTVNYKGTLADGTVFDSSYKRGEPTSFPLNGVIKGWTEGLSHMPVGATWKFYIAPDYAYGKMAPATIGPNQALVFKVDLLSIKKPAKSKASKK